MAWISSFCPSHFFQSCCHGNTVTTVVWVDPGIDVHHDTLWIGTENTFWFLDQTISSLYLYPLSNLDVPLVVTQLSKTNFPRLWRAQSTINSTFGLQGCFVQTVQESVQLLTGFAPMKSYLLLVALLNFLAFSFLWTMQLSTTFWEILIPLMTQTFLLILSKVRPNHDSLCGPPELKVWAPRRHSALSRLGHQLALRRFALCKPHCKPTALVSSSFFCNLLMLSLAVAARSLTDLIDHLSIGKLTLAHFATLHPGFEGWVLW